METTLNSVVNVAGELVLVTGVLVVVSHPETARIIKALADGFVSALRAASGQR